MIGGFRKNVKRGNFRKKVITTDDDEEAPAGEEAAEVPVPVATVAPIIKIKPKNTTSTKTSLSFGEELEREDEFVLKRSKASLTLNEQVKRERKIKKKKGIIGQERNDTLEEKTIPSSSEFILTQSEIPFSANGFRSNKIDPVVIGDEHNYEDTAEHHFSMRMKVHDPSAIPDAATIYAMKKKREQARNFGGQLPAYIPLDSNKHEGRFKGGSSRLVREEMDDSSDDERIEMRGTNTKSHPALERRKQVAKALEEIEESSPHMEKDDDEILIWEDEQMKKGSKIPTNQPEKKYGPQLPDPKVTVPLIPGMLMGPAFNAATGLPTTYDYTGYYTPMGSAQAPMQQVVTVDMVERRLTDQLDTKMQLLRLHHQQRDKVKFDLDSSKENIETLGKKATDASDRFTFYQDIRGYIKDLLECLQEKVKKINELEESMHETLKKRAGKLVSRRLNDVKDEVDEVSGKTSTESERIANIKNRRIAEREARRTRRREYRKKTCPNIPHNEGMSSDDEMIASDTLRFNADEDKVLKETEGLFADVVEDFTSIRQVMNRFEQWKFAFNHSYKEAYLGLCLPKMFTPFIKLELLTWNPLKVVSKDFEDYDWYRTLILYGYHKGKLDAEDEDIKLIPNVIEKVLIPKLTVLIRDVWDPLSSKQTKVITFLFQRLVDDYPTLTKESKTTQTLVSTIVSRLHNSVESEIYIPLYSRDLLESKNSPALLFLERQFWKGMKLLQNLMEWNWLLSQKKLLQLGIDAILNRYLIIALQQFIEPLSTLEKAKSIINALPKEWFEKSDAIVAGMQSFSRCLSGLAATAYKAALGHTDIMEQKKMKITVKKIISLLMHIQAFDEARVVANSYAFRKDSDSPIPNT